jgi:hypothetical protein
VARAPHEAEANGWTDDNTPKPGSHGAGGYIKPILEGEEPLISREFGKRIADAQKYFLEIRDDLAFYPNLFRVEEDGSIQKVGMFYDREVARIVVSRLNRDGD